MAAKDSSKAADPTGIVEPDEARTDSRKICGIVMPIAAMGDDYSEEHWRRVRKILQRAIERATMRAQLVWENPEVDVIQSAILQNLYENDVVICDLSGLNPNVMLETGLRLSTKRPTIIVTDRVQRPPFDISTIGYIEYQRDLEYNAIEDFIERLSKKIMDVAKAADDKSYHSFVEQFRFETVTPATVNLTSDEYIKEKISQLVAAVGRIERGQRAPFSARPKLEENSTISSDVPTSVEIGRVVVEMQKEVARRAEAAIDKLPRVFCLVKQKEPGRFEFTIKILDRPDSDHEEGLKRALEVLSQFET